MKTLGTKLYTGTAGSGTAATAVAGIRSFDSMPDLKYDTFDASLVDQASVVKDWDTTLVDGGSLGLTLKGTQVQYAAMLALHDGTKKSWKIVFADLSTLIFDGIMDQLTLVPGGGTNGQVDVKISIKVTSLPVSAAAA